MKHLLDKLIKTGSKETVERFSQEEQLRRQINSVYSLVSNIYGSDKLVLKAGKMNVLQLMRSEKIEERVLALQRLVFDDPFLNETIEIDEIPLILDKIEDEVAEIIAKKTVEEELEKKIADKLQQRHDEYVQEIKMQVLKDNGNPENAQTLKKLANLEKLEEKSVAASALDVLRPQNFQEIIGQEKGVKALVSKLASPFPQHIIIYGPPGVGKTSAARLALDIAKKMKGSPFSDNGKFVEVDGTTLRWDPREITNPLLGSVHDPIYQGARRDLADTGVPEPKLGLVTEANGGILFIDEIGEVDPMLQNKLLKVLEDKRVYFESSYYDPDDINVPLYIKKIFENGAPANFVLIGATTKEPEYINPAIRSRCTGIFFEPLTPKDIEKIIYQAAEKLRVQVTNNIAALISEYTMEGRKAISLLCDAYALAHYKQKEDEQGPIAITEEDVYEVVQTSRLIPAVSQKGSEAKEIGKIFGLGVMGFLGSVIEIEAVAFPAGKEGQGKVRFNDTAGSMAKDSVFNATSVIRKLTGEEISAYDLHLNIVGGGRIDGPSAGAAITLASISAIQKRPMPQNIAVTGEISIQGKVCPVGGISEKIYGARQAGIKTILIPKENEKEVPVGLKGIEIIPVRTIEEMIANVFIGENSDDK